MLRSIYASYYSKYVDSSSSPSVIFPAECMYVCVACTEYDHSGALFADGAGAPSWRWRGFSTLSVWSVHSACGLARNRGRVGHFPSADL